MVKNKVEIGSATQYIIRDVRKLSKTLHEFLLSCGVTPKNNKLSTLVSELEKVVVIKPKVDYIHIVVDKQGYIKELEPFGAVTQKIEVPADVTRGYYKVVDGKIVVDELMRRKLWEV